MLMQESKILPTHKMQDCLDSLQIPLTVVWMPDEAQKVHGKIEGDTLLIFDNSENEAWQTLCHELVEYKLQSVTRPYRLLVNALIETVEKTVYAQKEEFLEFLPKIFEIVQKNKK